jgi:TolB protein
MSLTSRPWSALVLLAGSSLFAGCSVLSTNESTSGGVAANAPHDSSKQELSKDSAKLAGGRGTRVTPIFNGGPSNGSGLGDPGRPELSEESQFDNVVSVGLYGETAPGEEPIAALQGESNIKQVSFAAEGGDFTPDVDRSGSFLVYASKQHSMSFDIYRKAIDGRTVTQVTSDPSDDMMPAVSPDGRWLAFVSNRTGNWDVFVMSAEGGPPTQITFETDDEVQPTWSPDGKQLAFARKNARTSRWEVWTTTAHEPSGSTFLCEGFLPRWSPDASSNRILFQRARQQGSRFYGIWTIRLENGQASSPTEIVSAQNAAVIQPSWSPDGQRIVFTTVVDPIAQSGEMPEQSDLWIVNVDGTGRASLTGGHFRNMQPVWAADEHIYFVSNRAGVENLWCVSVKPAPDMDHGSSVANAHEAESATAEPVADGTPPSEE